MAANNPAGNFRMRPEKHNLNIAISGEAVLHNGHALPPPRSWQECFSTTNELSNSILHDLRNPLTAISGCAELLLGENLDPIQIRRVTTTIQRAAVRMQDLVANLASMMRGDNEAIEFCNLRAIVEAACEAAGVADHNGIEMFLNVPARLEIALVRTRIERVFLNLVVNALEAMNGCGEIRIIAADAGDCVRISVEDNGPGVPSEIRGRLFEPFVTAGKKQGMGLGLTYCRQTIRDHGGELWLEAAAGARFVIFLPKQCEFPVGANRNHADLNNRSYQATANTRC
jgi:signal transduction histidine kinase